MFRCRYCVKTNRPSSFHTFITADLYGLMTNLITLTSRGFSVTCLSEKVLILTSLFREILFAYCFKPLSSYLFHIVETLTGYQFDYVFDWTVLKYPQIGSSSGSSSRTRVIIKNLILVFLPSWFLSFSVLT